MKYKQNVKIAIKLIIYRITYEIIFYYIIVNYYGSILQNPSSNAFRYVISWLIYLILIIPSSQYLFKGGSVSKGIIVFLLLLYYIPGTVYFAYREISYKYFFYFIIHYLFLIIFFKQEIKVKLPTVKKSSSETILNTITIIVVITAIAVSAIFNQLKITLSLDDVYVLREVQRQMDIPAIVGYFQPFASIYLPFAMAYYLDGKNYILTILTIFSQILLFSFGGMKTTLFLIPAILFCYYIIKKYKLNNMEWAITLFIIINISFYLYFLATKNINLVSLFQVRAMLTPNRISVLYYDFFSKNVPDYFRQSFLRYFGISSPYYIPISKLIAQTYDGTNSSLNNGLLGDVFMNFGKIGALIQPLLWAAMLKVLDSASRLIKPWIAISLSVAYAMIIPNMSFVGSMITCGFIIMCIIISFVPKDAKLT